MPTIRSTAELEALSAEAERLVRAGESRADVALALDVPLSTMTDWARKGRWLRRDLEAEQRPELTRLMTAKIAELRAREKQQSGAPPCVSLQNEAASRPAIQDPMQPAAATAAAAADDDDDDDEKTRLGFADPAGNASS
jgi:hypothetical protein